jgi:hypothetical protein
MILRYRKKMNERHRLVFLWKKLKAGGETARYPSIGEYLSRNGVNNGRQTDDDRRLGSNGLLEKLAQDSVSGLRNAGQTLDADGQADEFSTGRGLTVR